jgi:hypothetical protein
LKDLRVSYRDYSGKPDAIKGYRFQSSIDSKEDSIKNDLQEFYKFLKEPLVKAIFLIYATGLRRKEFLNLKISM